MIEQYYTCICGKQHLKSKEIRCNGKGHQVYINPTYFTYDVNAPKATAEAKPQLKFF